MLDWSNFLSLEDTHSGRGTVSADAGHTKMPAAPEPLCVTYTS